MKDEGT